MKDTRRDLVVSWAFNASSSHNIKTDDCEQREERAGNSCHGAGAQCGSQGLLLGVLGLCPCAVLGWGLWLHGKGSTVTRTPPASWPGPQEGQSGGSESRENKPLGSWVGWFRARLHL